MQHAMAFTLCETRIAKEGLSNFDPEDLHGSLSTDGELIGRSV
jgi:hypothetical protein